MITDLLLKPNSEINLPCCLEGVILFSKSHANDCIGQTDPYKVHGTPWVPKEELRQASVCRRWVSRVVWDWICPTNFRLFIRFSAGCVGIPFPAYSAPLSHYITTLDGTIAYLNLLACWICLLLHNWFLFTNSMFAFLKFPHVFTR